MPSKRLFALLILSLGIFLQAPDATFFGTAFLLAILFTSCSAGLNIRDVLLYQYLPLFLSKAIAATPYLASVLPSSQSIFLSAVLSALLSLVYLFLLHAGVFVSNGIPLGLPFVWALGNCVLSRIAPIGRLAAFALAQESPYSPLASYFGFPVIDLIQSTFAYAASELFLSASNAPSNSEQSAIRLPDDNDFIDQERRWQRTHRHPALLLTALIALSAFTPTPLNFAAQSFKIGCALPEGEISLEAMLHETRVSASRGARIVLWPEAAVYLANTAAYESFQTEMHAIADNYGILIASTYSRPMKDKRTNSVDIYTRDQMKPLLTYNKAHLLPYVESYPTLASEEESSSTLKYDIALSEGGSRRHRDTARIELIPQICHDTSFPLVAPALRMPQLELVTASVPSAKLSIARLSELRIRALERSADILVCDASYDGISGLIDLYGHARVLQTGIHKTFEVEVPYVPISYSTLHSRLGDTGSLCILAFLVLLVTLLGQLSQYTEEIIGIAQELRRRFSGNQQVPLLGSEHGTNSNEGFSWPTLLTFRRNRTRPEDLL